MSGIFDIGIFDVGVFDHAKFQESARDFADFIQADVFTNDITAGTFRNEITAIATSVVGDVFDTGIFDTGIFGKPRILYSRPTITATPTTRNNIRAVLSYERNSS